MNGTGITRIGKRMLLVGLCLLGAMLPQAKADGLDETTIFTFNNPVEVPGMVLPAGTYVFKLINTTEERDIVEVTSKDGKIEYGFFVTIPDYRMKPTGKAMLTFDERADGSPEAVKVWFYPDDSYGHQFVYPKAKAVQLAKANNTPVASMPDWVTANMEKPIKPMKGQSVVAMKKVSLKAQRPDEGEVEIAEVFMPPPPEARLPKNLPQTASQLPLIGLIGLLSLAIAVCLRFAAARIK